MRPCAPAPSTGAQGRDTPSQNRALSFSRMAFSGAGHPTAKNR